MQRLLFTCLVALAGCGGGPDENSRSNVNGFSPDLGHEDNHAPPDLAAAVDANQGCVAGGCTACTAGVACTPANPCHNGLTSCATGVPVCVDQSTNAADGASCGTNQVCKSGVCGGCTAGVPCSTGDPCQTGKTTCATGSPVCIPSGATAATTCGSATKGTCVDGACQCPPGSGFYAGDCQPCPGGSSDPKYVNANPTVGQDNQCCGSAASPTSGGPAFGGPCLTIAQAIANGDYHFHVTGDPQGNVSANESYPIHLRNSVSLSGSACIPGVAGKDVLHVDGTRVTLAGLTLGSDCQGNASGAIDGVYVGPNASATVGVTIAGVKNGLHVDGGAVTATGSIHDVSGEGVLCRSDSNSSVRSWITFGGLSIFAAAQHDVYGSSGCTMDQSGFATLELGDPTPCPAHKRDQFGLYLEGDASVKLSTVRGTCMAQDGISLRHNAGLGTNAPQANITGTFSHNGCAGAYVEVGNATVAGTFSHNHWGVIQHSARASSNSSDFLVGVTNSVLVCNTQNEPGACSGGGIGAQIFNDSGLPLSAEFCSFADSPVNVCNCNSTLSSCTCTGGGTTPPDGVDVLDAPLSSGAPTTDVTGFNTISVDCSKE